MEANLAPEMYSTVAERAVLACCLQSKLARNVSRERLSGGDFYVVVHEELWDAMNRLDQQGMEVDPVSMLAVVRANPTAIRLLTDLVTYPVLATSIDTHCHEVRHHAQRRRLYSEAVRLQQLCLNPDTDPLGLAASAVTRFAGIRDTGASEEIESMTVEELMLEVPEEADWLVPGFLERSDRFMLTGEEGLGKSHLLRQIVILAHAGLNPFRPNERIDPVRGMIIDFENSKRQVRRRLQQTYLYAQRGRGAPGEAAVLALPRSDITSDRVLSKIHRELDHRQPSILAIGPLYRMSPRALNDDTDATPVLAALDTIRDRGIAVLIEAHAGHTMGAGRSRDLRPRGSSQFMGWPEFGYGMKAASDGSAVLVPWRGDRDLRDFPTGLHQENGLWVEQRPMTLRQVWTPPENWDDLEEGPAV